MLIVIKKKLFVTKQHICIFVYLPICIFGYLRSILPVRRLLRVELTNWHLGYFF